MHATRARGIYVLYRALVSGQSDCVETYTIDGSTFCLVTCSDSFRLVSKLATLKQCNIYLMHTDLKLNASDWLRPEIINN
jgi:hypothetical protein